MNKNVLIAGGTGFVGKKVSKLFAEKGFNTAVLSGQKNIAGTKSFYWNYANNYIDPEAVKFADIVINLAGENIATKRWTKNQKQKILESRVKTTQLLFNSFSASDKKLELFINASAVGYYGSITSCKIFSETDRPGNDFLAETALNWEKAAFEFEKIGVRTVVFRIGIVLDKNGGSLKKMLLPVKLGIASPLGNGKQYMPWIALSDLAQMFLFAVDNSQISGVYNAVSPEFINNKQFMKSLAKSMNKPFFMPNVPAFVLKLLFGQMAEILLEGSRISNQKIIEKGFSFKYQDLDNFLS